MGHIMHIPPYRLLVCALTVPCVGCTKRPDRRLTITLNTCIQNVFDSVLGRDAICPDIFCVFPLSDQAKAEQLLGRTTTTVMRRLTTGIRSEKRVVRRSRRCANVT